MTLSVHRITDIPDELLIIILCFLSDRTLLETLYNTSKRFRILIINYRYNLIKLKEKLNDVRLLQNFIRPTIVTRANGDIVKYVHFYGFVEDTRLGKTQLKIIKQEFEFEEGAWHLNVNDFWISIGTPAQIRESHKCRSFLHLCFDYHHPQIEVIPPPRMISRHKRTGITPGEPA